MLIRFSVENFLSYNKKQTFSMIAGRTQNHLDHIFKIEDVSLLKLSAIYGANASGKSKIFEAMKFASYVAKSNLPLDSKDMFCKQAKQNETQPSLFEFEFYTNGSFYAYGFSAILSQQTVTAEWLYKLYPSKDKQEYIFEREFDNTQSSYNLNINKSFLNLSDEEIHFLNISNDFMDDRRILLLNTVNKSKKATNSKHLMSFVDVYKYFTSNLDFIMPDTVIQSFECYENSEDNFQSFIDAVRSFDTGIIDIKNDHIDISELETKLPSGVYKAIAKALDENQNNSSIKGFAIIHSGPTGWYRIEQKAKEESLKVTTIILHHKNSVYDFAFSEESDGTQKIFDLLRIVIQNKEGGVYIVDELERSLHPKVTERLLQLFVEVTKGKGTQLIFTTHESSIMSQDVFRRDEIWFVEKNEDNASIIYSLDKFSERYDRKIDKAYLDGRYGALPIFTQTECKGGDQ